LRSIIFWNAANASFLLLYFTALNIQYPFLLRHSTGTKVQISEDKTKKYLFFLMLWVWALRNFFLKVQKL
jgi:hypothetical protein